MVMTMMMIIVTVPMDANDKNGNADEVNMVLVMMVNGSGDDIVLMIGRGGGRWR